MTYYPPAPPPPSDPSRDPAADPGEAPRDLRRVVVLLLINLGLSVLLTVITLLARHSVVSYELDHRHIVDAQQRATLRTTYTGRAVRPRRRQRRGQHPLRFLVRALFRGRRWAYRRVIWVGGAGIVGLVIIQTTPYPPWMRAEQLLQAAVLATLVWFVTRPAVKAHFAAHLPDAACVASTGREAGQSGAHLLGRRFEITVAAHQHP